MILFLAIPFWAKETYTNALIKSKSPYLLHHAYNPVNWYPYTKEAFEKARKEDKLIFLSLGYSTCHWCHVMERESFENEKIAALLNRDYISIKVDKEEMPQIDTYYQRLHHRLTQRRNGWPLTIIMTPKKEILYIATYVPAEDKYGVEGLAKLLPKYAGLYRHDRAGIEKIVAENRKKIARKSVAGGIKDDQNLTRRYVAAMQRRFDKIYKGFDRRPRFPMASYMRLLLNIYLLNGDKDAWQMVEQTLEAMAMGGIYDQIEGGFFRYTTDQDWIVPHYEKMLYTNAELIPIYVKAYLLTDNPLFKKVVTETIAEYHHRLEEDHLFFGATDADTEGKEGGYFVYDYTEVKKALEKADFNTTQIENLMEYFDITQPGNFKDDLSNVHFNTGFEQVPKGVVKLKKILKQMRQKRNFPFIDKKIITSWNAMMIKALFKASALDAAYRKEALRSLEALLHKNYKNGTLYHYSIGFGRPEQVAFLEDYAFLIDAILEAYAQTYRQKYLDLAVKLTSEAIGKFYSGGRWYLNEDEPRIENRYLDKYYTTPLARMFHDLLTLASLTYDLKRYAKTKKMIADEKERILAAFDKSPEALGVLIRLRYGDILLKAPKEQLERHRKEITRVRYPFLLTKSEATKLYLLCNMQSCFYYDRNLTKVIEKIKPQ